MLSGEIFAEKDACPLFCVLDEEMQKTEAKESMESAVRPRHQTWKPAAEEQFPKQKDACPLFSQNYHP